MRASVCIACLPKSNLPIKYVHHPPSYSAGVGDCAARGASTGASAVLGDRVGASLNDDDTLPSRPALSPAAPAVAAVPPAIGSGDSVRSIAICWPSRDSGGRTPPRRKRGIGRELRRSVGGGGGSESSAVLGIHERNVRGDRVSGCVVIVAVEGAGLDRALEVAADPHPIPIPVPVPEPVLAPRLALSEMGLHGNSGRRVGKNRRGGTHVVFGDRRDDVVGVVESSVSVSGLGSTLLLPSRPDERRREVKSVKSTVRERAGRRRMEGWRVSGGADGTCVGDGGPHPSGEVSRRTSQSSRRVAERSI